MKFIFLIGFMFPLMGKTQEQCYYLDKSNYTGWCYEIGFDHDSTIYWYENGIPSGKKISYFNNGQIRLEQKAYSNSDLTWTCVTFYKNGHQHFEIEITNGTGYIKFYHQNGRLKSKGNFEDGQPIGTWQLHDTLVKVKMHTTELINSKLNSMSEIYSVYARNMEIMSLKNDPQYPGKIVISEKSYSKLPPDYLLNYKWHSDTLVKCWKHFEPWDTSFRLKTVTIDDNLTIGYLIERNYFGELKQEVYIYFGQLIPYLEGNVVGETNVVAYCWYIDPKGKWVEEKRGAMLMKKDMLMFNGYYFPCAYVTDRTEN
jgi:hypothetical protein